MKKQAINYSWPASLSGFNQDTAHENFSRGKLKVFYKGETADHRFFSDAFSEELVQSLPYTPVVSYYDEEKEDFVGHATEQQIYGMVDPKKEPSFEKDENGITWCVCDVVLYTERPDKVGDIAKKIVGHKQSLELDPNSVKYTINYDERKHFKNIEFTAGRFVGVSVLGNDQKPAFTGSEFFEYNENFENKMKVLRDYCEGKADQEKDGGEEMNLQEFMKLSWGDISLKVEEALNREYQDEAYVSIIDMYDDNVVARFYFYLEGTQKLMRIYYECDPETQDVQLGKINEVRIRYEDVEVIPTSVKEGTDIKQVEVKEEPECPNCEPIVEPIVEPVVECPEIKDKPCDEHEEKEVKIEITLHENTSSDAGVEDASCKPSQPVESKDEEDPKKTITDAGCGNKEEKKETDCKCGDPKDKEDCECGKPEEKKDCECGEPKDKEDCKCGDPKKKNCECDRPEDHPDVKPGDPLPPNHPKIDEDDKEDCFENPAQVENVEIAPDNKKVSVENEESFNNNQENSSSTSFTQGERAEFEALKREKKIALVESFKESISESQYNNFLTIIDTTDFKDLELELLKAYKASEENKEPKPMRAFAFAPINNAAKESSLDSFVRKNLRR